MLIRVTRTSEVFVTVPDGLTSLKAKAMALAEVDARVITGSYAARNLHRTVDLKLDPHECSLEAELCNAPAPKRKKSRA